MLPDKNVVSVTLNRTCSTEQVYQAVMRTLSLDADIAQHFSLFEIEEYNFGKLSGEVFHLIHPRSDCHQSI